MVQKVLRGHRKGGAREKREWEGYRRREKRRQEAGFLRVAGSGRNRGKLCNIMQYFAIEKSQRDRSPKK